MRKRGEPYDAAKDVEQRMPHVMRASGSHITTGRPEDHYVEGINTFLDDWGLTLFTFSADGTCCVVRCARVRAIGDRDRVSGHTTQMMSG